MMAAGHSLATGNCCATLSFEGSLEVWSEKQPGHGELLWRANSDAEQGAVSMYELSLDYRRLSAEFVEGDGLLWRMAVRGVVLKNSFSALPLWSSCPLFERPPALGLG